MKKLQTTLALLGLGLAVGGAWWVQNRPQSADGLAGAGPSAGASVAVAVRVASGASAPAGQAGPGGAGPVVVEAGKVIRMRLETDTTAVGSLRSNQGVMMRPEVSGRIVKLGFADGQRVQRGQLLVQLDDTLQQAQARQAEAQASIARTNLQRSRELLAQNFVSQSAVDQNAAALEVAMAQVALSQAQLQRMVVNAPFDGIAGLRLVNVGDYVKDGADLVNIEDNSSMWVDFRLPERYLERIRPGLGVSLSFDSLPGKQLGAKVVALDSQLDANGRSVLVRARTVPSDSLLRPGMFARVRVVFSASDNALVVPEEALVPQGGKQFVILLVHGGPADAQGRPGKVTRRVEARIGQRGNGRVQLLDGVAEGDQVVLAGHSRLLRADGLPVRVIALTRTDPPVRAPDTPAPGAAPARVPGASAAL